MSTETERRPKVVVAPLVPLALAVVAGILADRFGNPWGTSTWAAIAFGGAVVAGSGVVRRRPGVTTAPALLVAWMALGGGWHHERWSDLAADDLARSVSATPRPAWVRGVLRDVLGARAGTAPGEAGTTRAVLEVTGVRDGRSWRRASGGTQLVIVGARTDLRAGQTVEAVGNLALIAGPLNPGEFDARDYLRAQGIRLILTVDDRRSVWRDTSGASWPLTRLLGSARAWSYSRLVGGIDQRAAPLAAALLLGRREAVSPDVNDAFARTATTHLLAISGLHLQVLAGALWLTFRALGVGRRGSFATVALATVAYALLVGLMPSVVRSAAMTVTLCVGGMRDRVTRPANLLALAALITLLLNPAHLFDVGCQLSFLAIAAIVWLVEPAEDVVLFGYYGLTMRQHGPTTPLDALERRLEPWWKAMSRRRGGLVLNSVLVSLVVWLAALPLVALRFHLVSPIGILLNLPLIPITSLALLAAGLTLGLSALWGPLGMPASWACSRLLGATEWLVRWGSARSWGHGFVAGPPWEWVIGFYVLLGLATAAWVGRWPGRRWAWRLVGGWAVLGLGLSCRPRHPEALEAEVLAVGHGLAVVIQASDGHTIVYDCGRMRDPSVGRRIVAPALWSRGVRHLDAVILSHADADHYNGLPDLLDRFSIGAVLIPPGFEGRANPGAAGLMDQVRARGVPVRTVVAGEGWRMEGDTSIQVLHPPAGWRPDASDNARSVVLEVAGGTGARVLLTGDLDGPGLEELRARAGPAPGAILAPHHGGRTANPPWLYRWSERAIVVVSQRRASAGPRDPLTSVAARGVPVLRTWQRGAVLLRWTGQGLIAQGFLDRPNLGRSRGTSRWSSALPAWSRVLVGALGFALGLAFCVALAVAEWGAWSMVVPGRRLGADEPEPVTGEPIEARGADGVRLAGHWHQAEGSRGRTALVLHGFADPSTLSGRVEVLTRQGWNVATIDSRGHGQSGGDRVSFGGRESGDLRAWIDVLAERIGPPLKLAVWGRSMGAAIALRAAADDSRVAALVLESPYADLRSSVAAWLRAYRLPLARLLARLILRRAEALAGVSLDCPRPIDLAPRVVAATLIVHGTDDALVSLAEARLLASAFPRPATLIEVAGAGHPNVVGVGGHELLERIIVFMDDSTSIPDNHH